MARITTGVWGLFCACSWTWCIGMYLPIVLLERYGWPGFLAFAVPNVLGCAAFGYVLRDGRRSEQLVRQHATALRCFSVVTVAYHVYFAGWLAADLLPPGWRHPALPIALPLALCAAGLLTSTLRDRWWLLLAPIVYLVSLTTFVSLLPDGLAGITWTGREPPTDVAWLAPVLCFGFGLCPYLDPTFHRALQRSSSPHAFAVFGAAFAVMIVLTCAYWARPGLRLEPLVIAHLAAQAVFTVGAHLRELVRSAPARRPAWLLAPLAALVVLLATRMAPEPGAAAADTYLRFLVFYGALFPAYVLIIVAIGRTVDRASIVALLVVTLLLAPFYELGMLHGRSWLMPIPVALYIVWAMIRRRGVRGPAPAA